MYRSTDQISPFYSAITFRTRCSRRKIFCIIQQSKLSSNFGLQKTECEEQTELNFSFFGTFFIHFYFLLFLLTRFPPSFIFYIICLFSTFLYFFLSSPHCFFLPPLLFIPFFLLSIICFPPLFVITSFPSFLTFFLCFLPFFVFSSPYFQFFLPLFTELFSFPFLYFLLPIPFKTFFHSFFIRFLFFFRQLKINFFSIGAWSYSFGFLFLPSFPSFVYHFLFFVVSFSISRLFRSVSITLNHLLGLFHQQFTQEYAHARAHFRDFSESSLTTITQKAPKSADLSDINLF